MEPYIEQIENLKQDILLTQEKEKDALAQIFKEQLASFNTQIKSLIEEMNSTKKPVINTSFMEKLPVDDDFSQSQSV